MRAVVIQEPGGPQVLSLQEVPSPPLHAGQVRVQVKAVGLNRADLLQRKGLYPAPPGYPAQIPGLEFAGTILELGPGVDDWVLGARVMGITGGGAYADEVVVYGDSLLPVPPSWSWIQAAAFPEAHLTAFDALRIQADLQLGQRLLIHAVGSGVGLAALQLAQYIGVTTYGTSRTAEKLAKAQRLGLHHGIQVQSGQFLEQLRTLTQGQGVHVILDFIGAAYLQENVKALSSGGVLVVLGLMGGTQAPLPLEVMLSRRLTVRGSTLRARSREDKTLLVRRYMAELGDVLRGETFLPIIDGVYPVEAVQEAHQRLEQNESFGKLVLKF